MINTTTTVEVEASPPWYVRLHNKTVLPVAILVGVWGLVWAFAGLTAYFTPRFPPAFVSFLAFAWMPVAVANFVLSALTGRYYNRLMQAAVNDLRERTHDILGRIDADMRERFNLPPVERPTIQ